MEILESEITKSYVVERVKYQREVKQPNQDRKNKRRSRSRSQSESAAPTRGQQKPRPYPSREFREPTDHAGKQDAESQQHRDYDDRQSFMVYESQAEERQI